MRVQELLAFLLPGTDKFYTQIQEAYEMIHQCGLTDQAEDIIAAAQVLYRTTAASWADCVREVVESRLLPSR